MGPSGNAVLLHRAALHGVELPKEQADHVRDLFATADKLDRERDAAKDAWDKLKAKADEAKKAYEAKRDASNAAAALASATKVQYFRTSITAAERSRIDREKARLMDQLAQVLADEKRMAG